MGPDRTASDVAFAHLDLRLRPLNRALRAAVARQAAAAQLLTRPDLTAFCITDEQVGGLLDRIDALDVGEPAAEPIGLPLTEPERATERELRERAAAEGRSLPLDALSARAGLSAVEQDMLVLAVAPELDRGYERVVAYVLDDLNRRQPCVELLCAVGAATAAQRWARRRLLGAAGRLRRYGVLRLRGDAPTTLRQELRVAPGIVELLLGGGGDLAALVEDPGAVVFPAVRAPSADPGVARLGAALGAGAVDVVGLWRHRRCEPVDAVGELAAAAGVALRRLPAGVVTVDGAAEALAVAAALGAVLWIDADRLDGTRDAVADLVAGSTASVCLTGTRPWRPPQVVGRRSFAEVKLADPGYLGRRATWLRVLPEVTAPVLDDLAARYRMGGMEMAAVAAMARSPALPDALRNGALSARVSEAAAALAHGAGGVSEAIMPRRTLDDLVLPADQLAKLRELLAAFRHWPRIAQDWGFARRHGSGGVTALFAGESGTGKTLAAEVIAGSLGLVLLKVDLSRTVSKWVGETEKHLEDTFAEAEDAHAVLFFDEADALFGKRGEISHGVDR